MALYPTCRGHCRCPHGRQRGDFDGRQHADASWAIGRRMRRYRERWRCRVPLHRAGSSAGQKINPEQWPAGYGVVESAGYCLQPAGSADCRLAGSAQPLFCGAERFIKLISVRVAENEHVDVTHGPRTSLPFTSDGPRAVDVRRRGPFDVGQGGSEYGRNPEGTGGHLGQSRVVGTWRCWHGPVECFRPSALSAGLPLQRAGSPGGPMDAERPSGYGYAVPSNRRPAQHGRARRLEANAAPAAEVPWASMAGCQPASSGAGEPRS